MTTLARPFSGLWSRIEQLRNSLMSRRNIAAPPEDRQEDVSAERDFILEMMDKYPDAFQSELDIHNLAHLYRGKF